MILIDTSVAIKWLNKQEEHREQALLLFKNHLEKTEQIAVPHLFFIESANALGTKSILTESEITEGITFLFASQMHVIMETQDMLKESALLARKYGTSVYDMLYAVIAKEQKSLLYTADQRFIEKTKFPFVKLLSKLA